MARPLSSSSPPPAPGERARPLISDMESELSPSMSMTMSDPSNMYAAVIYLHAIDVYARSIYYCGMEPEVAKYHFGALALAVADSIASVSASLSPSGPGTAVMVLLSMEPGLPITVLATHRHETRPGRRR